MDSFEKMKAQQDAIISRAFVDFVLRHTWPERAKAHGYKVVHDIIKHHPFAQAYVPKQQRED